MRVEMDGYLDLVSPKLQTDARPSLRGTYRPT